MHYVHCAKIQKLSSGSDFYLIIRMSPQMSSHLMQAACLSIDTSFKHVVKWQEFKIQLWDNLHQRCKLLLCLKQWKLIKSLAVVSACAFINSQSAEAYFILFCHIFEIATQDSGHPVAFHYIHGYGIESVVADAHQGQGLDMLKLLKFSIHCLTVT